MLAVSTPPTLAGVEYTLVDLGTLGGSRAIAYAVSDNGQAAGAARDPSSTWHAFRWNSTDGMVELGINASLSSSYGINNAGHVTGSYQQPDTGLQAYRWTMDDGLIDLPDLGGGQSAASEISNTGIIAGDSFLPTGESHAVFWDDQNVIHDLGTFPNGGNSGCRRGKRIRSNRRDGHHQQRQSARLRLGRTIRHAGPGHPRRRRQHRPRESTTSAGSRATQTHH